MNTQKLIDAAKKPKVYTEGTASMWVDEYISGQLLETHLSQETDLASRKESTIAATVGWVLNQVPGATLSILDLGCGPGLYAEKLAEQGHRVTGMDFSAGSIRYARESARRKGLNISYTRKDYLTMEEEETYDLVLMVFLDFCVLTPDERDTLLARIYRALKPGGHFVLDVLNDTHPMKASEGREWELAEKGFWRDRPYIALSEAFYYEEEKTLLNQHVVMDDSGNIDIYRFWRHTFSHAAIEQLLASRGFCRTECHDGILPDCDLYRSDEVTFCITSKPQ